ncbi:MAG: ABC transporter ATP-binding protein [Caldisphaera sp.]|nr:MAG: ABC transporter ATP-binding protein [Caldisphaera sp.]
MENNLKNDNKLKSNLTPLVKVEDFHLHYYTRRGVYKALNGVDLEIRRGEVLGVAGESGCGKSTLGRAIMGILPRNAAVVGGKILIDGVDYLKPLREYYKNSKKFKPTKNQDILKKVNEDMSNIRGQKISMVFQEPMTTLNPLLSVGYQIAEVLIYHNPGLLASRRLSRARATKEDTKNIIKILKDKGIGEEFKQYLKTRHIEGLEDQVLAIWRRKDLHDLKKEQIIQDLCCQPISSMAKGYLESIEKNNKLPNFSRIPIVGRILKRELLGEAYKKASEFLGLLGIPNPDKVVYMYPHELSGGQRQRIVIASAMINNPDLVILDEPTSALDVTIQAQILELVKELKESINSAYMFISHDLSVLAEVSDRIAIMYAGQVVEVGPKSAIFDQPKHPYTQMLMDAIPTIEAHELKSIKGEVPDMRNPPKGCMFQPRCPYAMPICSEKKPKLVKVGEDHYVACFLYEGEKS